MAAINPVELSRAVWTKSSRSTNNGGACVEVAPLASVVVVRDSKLPTIGDFPILAVSGESWAGLLAEIRTGRLDG